MSDKICMPKNYFFIILIIFICFTIYHRQYYNTYQSEYKLNEIIYQNNQLNKKNQDLIDQNNINNTKISLLNNDTSLIDNKLLINNNNIQSKYNYNDVSLINNNNISLVNESNYLPQKSNLMALLPLKTFLENRDKSILYDPLISPERRVPRDQYPLNIQNEINIPSRGYPDSYQILGLLSRDKDEKIIQLFGRATFPGSNQWEYYVTTEQNGFTNKIPIQSKGNREIEDNTNINIPILKGEFQVKLYNYNTPRYNPWI